MTKEKCPDCGKYLLEVNGKKGKMLICQDRECGYRRSLSLVTNARCPNCHKKMELRKQPQRLGVTLKIIKIRQHLLRQKLCHRRSFESKLRQVPDEPFPDRRLSEMPERRIADVVGESRGLRNRPQVVGVEIFRELVFDFVENGDRQTASDAGNLDGMGQSAVDMVIDRKRMHLRLAP